MIELAKALQKADSNYDWLFTDPEYLLALPDVGLDHQLNKIPLSSPNA